MHGGKATAVHGVMHVGLFIMFIAIIFIAIYRCHNWLEDTGLSVFRQERDKLPSGKGSGSCVAKQDVHILIILSCISHTHAYIYILIYNYAQTHTPTHIQVYTHLHKYIRYI